jgi:putative Mn2+ efflux pump MntP
VALLPLTFAATPLGLPSVVLVNIVFAVCTIGTMLVVTTVASLGATWIRMEFFDKYGDVITGVVIGCLGIMTKVFGI